MSEKQAELNQTGVEIERKWLCDGFPPWQADSEEMQQQGYLCFAPAVRIRKVTQDEKTTCMLTIKGKGTLARTEVELPISEEQYDQMVPLLAAPMAQKHLRRYRLPDGHVLECSHVDEDEACAFYYAEVEFDTEEEARRFAAPDWLGREVTEEPGYTMAAHCRAKLEQQP